MTGRGLLLSELEWIVGNCCRLIELLRKEHKDWQPQEGMRTLTELCNHLSQIPAVDLRIIKGDSEQEVCAREKELWRDNPGGWCEVMHEGTRDMIRYMEHLSFDDFENGSGMAYFGRTQTNAKWLLETINHVYHHRAQLFMYMKLNNYEVSTKDLYS